MRAKIKQTIVVEKTDKPCERWIWLELIGFDNTEKNYGVKKYLAQTGFVPDGISLLLSSPDFILLHDHDGLERERKLPADICSRQGHEHNPERKRQIWTNCQLRALIRHLHRYGVQVFISVFAQFNHNKFHQEWLSAHPEIQTLYAAHCTMNEANVLKRMRDGTYFEDFFITKLLEAIQDYNFDGWHGCDGYGPLCSGIWEADCSDDMLGQFCEATGTTLPPSVRWACGADFDRLKKRADWLWAHRRREWIEFYTDRWAGFWRKVSARLHAVGKKAFINSAWTRAPFEAIYRFGVDYRKIAQSGVDGIVVETVAAGLASDQRPRAADEIRHYDYLAMLMLIKAYVPETRLIFLHNTHDVVECWDVLRHAPTILEKEIYSLANVFYYGADGKPRRCADGFLACLGDGIRREEWRWLQEKWSLAFSRGVRPLGVTLLAEPQAIRNQVDEYLKPPFGKQAAAGKTCGWSMHWIAAHLMVRGVPIQAASCLQSLPSVPGPVLILNPQLYAHTDLQHVLKCANGPVIMIGRQPESLSPPDFQFADVYHPQPMWCGVFGKIKKFKPEIRKNIAKDAALNQCGSKSFLEQFFWDFLPYQKASAGFLDACAEVVVRCAELGRVISGTDSATLMFMEVGKNKLRVAVKNKTHFYAKPAVEMRKKIGKIELLSKFPAMPVEPEGARFSVKVPGGGITVVDVSLG